MKRAYALSAGAALLALTWAGPLPENVPRSFLAHMTMHMSVVAVAAPLLVLGMRPRTGTVLQRVSMSPLLAATALFDLIVIWGWHTPLAHEAARTRPLFLAAEQASFLLVALLLWSSALYPRSGQGRLFGAGILLFTSMHMSLLGVLISLAQTPICRKLPQDPPPFGLTTMQDQQIGGLMMLGIGGTVYLAAGLLLLSTVLRGQGDISGEHR